MPLKATTLRAQLYRVLDKVLETGESVEILRHGKIIRLVPAVPQSKLDRLKSNPDLVVGDPDDLVHMDWSDSWKP